MSNNAQTNLTLANIEALSVWECNESFGFKDCDTEYMGQFCGYCIWEPVEDEEEEEEDKNPWGDKFILIYTCLDDYWVC